VSRPDISRVRDKSVRRCELAASNCVAAQGGDLSSTGFSLFLAAGPQLEPHRMNRLRKKAENCHSERRVCAKNPSWSFVFNREGFFASLRMTTKALFPQPVQPVSRRWAATRTTQDEQVAEIYVSGPSGVKTPEENADLMSCLKARPTKLKTFSATCEACATGPRRTCAVTARGNSWKIILPQDLKTRKDRVSPPVFQRMHSLQHRGCR
jgi:hypothetical protein